jgi:hypothetical protein
MTLEEVAALLAAREPEDVFGVVGDTLLIRRDSAKAVYRRLARACHPDAHGGDARAAEVFRALQEMWERALYLLDHGRYGDRRAATVTLRTRRATYLVGAKLHSGDFCDLFDLWRDPTTPEILKVARKPTDADLVQNEASVLKRLRRTLDAQWIPYLPEVVDRVGVRASGGIVRQANVLGRLDGFYTLEQVRAAYPGGVDPRDLAWMWRRLLAILGAVHRAGVVHAAVDPSHVLIHPAMHGLVLCDWAYSVPVGERPRAVPTAWRTLAAPELLDGAPTLPEADVYMAARSILHVAPGDGEGLPRAMRAHFAACQLDRAARPEDAWTLQRMFDDLLGRLYGPRRYRPFAMPTPAPAG